MLSWLRPAVTRTVIFSQPFAIVQRLDWHIHIIALNVHTVARNAHIIALSVHIIAVYVHTIARNAPRGRQGGLRRQAGANQVAEERQRGGRQVLYLHGARSQAFWAATLAADASVLLGLQAALIAIGCLAQDALFAGEPNRGRMGVRGGVECWYSRTASGPSSLAQCIT